MRRRVVVGCVLLVALALALFTVPVAISSAELLRTTLVETSQREAQLFAPLVVRADEAAAQSLADRTRDFQLATGSRVFVLRADDPPPDDDQVRAALRGQRPAPRWGTSDQLAGPVVSVVIPVENAAGNTVAAVQIIASASEVEARIRQIWVFRLSVGFGVLLVTGLLAVALARTALGPLARVDETVRRLGQGDYSAHAPETGPPEVVRLSRTLNDTARRTAALLQSQRTFVADASHQLRTPLTAIRLFLDNVRDTTGDPQVQRALEPLDAEIDRMGRLVEGLLTLARAESPGRGREVVDLAAVVAERFTVWSAALADAEVTELVSVPRPCPVLVTPGAVEQVLDNLVANALAVAPRGSRLHVRARARADLVELVVRDEGPGIPAEQRERAFDRFWRGGRGGQGSGLGLAIVRELVRGDDGRVSLGEAPGGGLEVCVQLRRG